MKKIIKKIDWIIDYYFVYFLYNGNKTHRYIEYMEKKYTQMYSAGNPFATPINLPTNIVGGALGIWAGYSPWYDTLICIP